jgi:hypothetical protein
MPEFIDQLRLLPLADLKKIADDVPAISSAEMAVVASQTAFYVMLNRLKSIVLHPDFRDEGAREDVECSLGQAVLAPFSSNIASDQRLENAFNTWAKDIGRIIPWERFGSRILRDLFQKPFAAATVRERPSAQECDVRFVRQLRKLIPAGEAVLLFAQLLKHHGSDPELRGGASITKAADFAAVETNLTRAKILSKIKSNRSILHLLAGFAYVLQLDMQKDQKILGTRSGMNEEKLSLWLAVAIEVQRMLPTAPGIGAIPVRLDELWHLIDDGSDQIDILPPLPQATLNRLKQRRVINRSETKTERSKLLRQKRLLH